MLKKKTKQIKKIDFVRKTKVLLFVNTYKLFFFRKEMYTLSYIIPPLGFL